MRQAGRGGNPIQPCAGEHTTHTTDELHHHVILPCHSTFGKGKKLVVLLF